MLFTRVWSRFRTVSLTIRSNSGLQTTTSTQVTATNGYPIAALQCLTNNLLVACNAVGSFDPENGVLTYSFDYGDNYVDTNQTGFSNHAYTTAGLRTVTVTVTDDFGNTNSASTQVMPIFPPWTYPVADFECTSNLPLSVYCFDRSTDSDGGVIVSRKITFDNGEEISLTNGSLFYQFATSGEHSASLTVIDNDGLTNTVTKTFTVKENSNPVVSLECFNSGPQKIMCYSTATDPDNGDQLIDFKWDFGDGQVESGLVGSVFHTYAESGTYTVKLTVKDQFGGVGSAEVDVTPQINLPPVATIDCENSGLKTISCHTFAYDPDVGLDSIIWQTSDGSQFTGTSFTHTFADAGTYTVTLKVKDLLGKETILTDEIDVLDNQRPTFDLYSDSTQGHLPLTVNFEAQNAIDPDGTIVSYEWLINNETVATTPTFNHIFEETGIYTVKLRVTDNHNGITEKTVTIGASNPSDLLIETNIDSGLAVLDVHFDASRSSDSEGEITKYEWLLRGEKIGEGPILDWEFDQIGVQYVELVTTNNFGVETRTSKSISVEQPPIYLEGNAPRYAFVGLSYESQYFLTLAEGINSENLTIALENAPVGVSYNQETHKLTWTPANNQVGDHVFKIILSDGFIHFYRNVRVTVHNTRTLGSINVGTGGGTFTINSQSILNGSVITLPQEESNYSINIYESGPLNKPIVHFTSNKEIKKPLNMKFPKELLINNIAEAELQSIENGLKSKGQYHITHQSDDLTFCATLPSELAEKNEKGEMKYEPYLLTLANASAYIDKTIRAGTNADKKIKNLLEDNIAMSKLPNIGLKYKIYFTSLSKNSVPSFEKGVAGLFVSSLPNSVFIDPIGSHLQYVLYHESFHAVQHNVLGCSKKLNLASNSQTFNNLYEGSADYFALKLLDDQILKTYTVPGRTYTERQFAVVRDYPYSEYKSFSASIENDFNSGFLRNTDHYRARLIFDHPSLDVIQILNYFNSRINTYDENDFSARNFGETLLIEFANSKGIRLENILLPMVDNLSNRDSLNPPTRINSYLISHLRNEELFSWENSLTSIEEFITFSDAPKTGRVTVSLPGISGVSIKLKTKEIISKIQSAIVPDQILVNYNVQDETLGGLVINPTDNNIRLNVRTSKIDGVSRLNFVEDFNNKMFTGNTIGTVFDPGENQAGDEKIVLNLVNTSNITKLVTINFSFECSVNCVPDASINVIEKDSTNITFSSNDINNKFSIGYLYKWNFGDGQTQTTSNKTITHNYSSPGNYNVTLDVVRPSTPEIILSNTTKQIVVKEWARPELGGNVPFEDALVGCGGILRGTGGWRLPSKLELIELLNYIEDGWKESKSFYWSSSNSELGHWGISTYTYEELDAGDHYNLFVVCVK